jgi:AcrR family transcriptional regulator
LVQPVPTRDHRTVQINRILGGAQRLFVAHGYQRTTLAQIAKEADLGSESSLHHYFKNKSELLLRLFVRIEEDVLGPMTQRVANAGPSVREKLIALLDTKVLMNRSYLSDALLRILMSLEFRNPDDKLCQEVRKIHRLIQRIVEGVIEFGKLRGVFRTDLETRELAAMIVGAHDGIMLELHRMAGAVDGEALIRSLQSSMLRGLEDETAVLGESELLRYSWQAPGTHP